MINIPKGTKDVLPSESYKWQYIEKTARETAELFGASEIRTPVFEHTEVFERGVGDTTDIVNKEMYTFTDKGGRSVTLKPEGTAGVCRAFVENGMASSPMPFKSYYITPCFRYERPQAGRLREFHQFGIEFIGSDSPSIDAEAIILAKTFFDKLGIKGLSLKLNSIGCKECRKEYYKALVEYFGSRKDELCSLCRERLEKNPMRILDCKNPECRRLTENAPRISDYLCDDCNNHFSKVRSYLESEGIEFSVDTGIVRGLDYYSKTVFEFVSENIGAQGTVCGGGRYDGLVEQFGGSRASGIGFALGIERLILLAESTGVSLGERKVPEVYFVTFGEEEKKLAFSIACKLRKKGIICDVDHMDRGVKPQFKYADKIGAKYVGIIGGNELAEGKVKLKNMKDGTELFVSADEIVSYLSK